MGQPAGSREAKPAPRPGRPEACGRAPGGAALRAGWGGLPPCFWAEAWQPARRPGRPMPGARRAPPPFGPCLWAEGRHGSATGRGLLQPPGDWVLKNPLFWTEAFGASETAVACPPANGPGRSAGGPLRPGPAGPALVGPSGACLFAWRPFSHSSPPAPAAGGVPCWAPHDGPGGALSCFVGSEEPRRSPCRSLARRLQVRFQAGARPILLVGPPPLACPPAIGPGASHPARRTPGRPIRLSGRPYASWGPWRPACGGQARGCGSPCPCLMPAGGPGLSGPAGGPPRHSACYGAGAFSQR